MPSVIIGNSATEEALWFRWSDVLRRRRSWRSSASLLPAAVRRSLHPTESAIQRRPGMGCSD